MARESSYTGEQKTKFYSLVVANRKAKKKWKEILPIVMAEGYTHGLDNLRSEYKKWGTIHAAAVSAGFISKAKKSPRPVDIAKAPVSKEGLGAFVEAELERRQGQRDAAWQAHISVLVEKIEASLADLKALGNSVPA